MAKESTSSREKNKNKIRVQLSQYVHYIKLFLYEKKNSAALLLLALALSCIRPYETQGSINICNICWCLVVLHMQAVFSKIVFDCLYFVARDHLHVLVEVGKVKIPFLWASSTCTSMYFLHPKL